VTSNGGNNNNNNATALSPHDEIKSSNPSLPALIYLKGISERYKANESEKQATWNCKKSSVGIGC
jgi:hypothetical protein